MKTKIIYISGGETYSVDDIRAAFEEVRGALNLADDTVLFGVTVEPSEENAAVDTIATEEKAIPILSVLSGKEEVADAPESVREIVAEKAEQEICDMIADAAPVAEDEKTLEKLFEKIAPLCEDTLPDESAPVEPVQSDADATLEKLAAEFVERQSEVIAEPKTGSRGKIGKLKNILPFKKAKRDDSGIMGDLFGWAGIAANDDEFSIPGFLNNKL